MAKVKRGARSATLAATTDVIMIGGKTYAAGLLWQAASKPKGFMREVKAFTKQYGLRQFVVREGAMTQIGYVVTGAGARPLRNAQALVPTLADRLGSSWLAVFQVTERVFVMGGVHNGAIIPEADLIGNEEEVRARFAEVITLPWGKTYAPKSFYTAADSLRLDEALGLETGKRALRTYPIRSTGSDFGRRELILYGGTAALALTGALIQHEIATARREEELTQAASAAARDAANLEKERKAAIEQVKRMAPIPQWPSEPAAKSVLMRCMATILATDYIPASIEGWRFRSASCNGQRITVTYDRSPGANQDSFLSAARRIFESVTATAEVGTANDPVLTKEPLRPRGEVELATSEQAQLQWTSHFQRLNIMTVPSLAKKADPPKKPPPPTLVKLIGEAQARAPDPWWDEYSFTVSSSFPLDQLMNPLLGNGLVIQEVIFGAALGERTGNGSQTALQWTMNGVVYAKK